MLTLLKAKAKSVLNRILGEVNTSKLVRRGMKVGKNFSRQQGCFIDPTHCFLISIGDNVTLSLRVTILAHDASSKLLIGYTRIGKVIIGNNVFIGANTTILPGVRIGNDVIIGANSVVTKDIPDDSVVVGNPAVFLKHSSRYKEDLKLELSISKKFDSSYRYSRKLTRRKITEIQSSVDSNRSFIE